MLYFDNRPPFVDKQGNHYGTIRQQVWSLLHFPLHLGIVGVVEGSQQLALARYVMQQSEKVHKSIYTCCADLHLDGTNLTAALNKTVQSLQLHYKPASAVFLPIIDGDLGQIQSMPGICAGNASEAGFVALHTAQHNYPPLMRQLFGHVVSSIYSTVSVDPLPAEERDMVHVAMQAWRIVFMYYWTSVAIVLACLAAFIIIVRLRRAEKWQLFDWAGVSTRALGVISALAIVGAGANSEDFPYTFIGRSLVIPVNVIILVLVIIFDRVAAFVYNRRLAARRINIRHIQVIRPKSVNVSEDDFISKERCISIVEMV